MYALRDLFKENAIALCDGVSIYSKKLGPVAAVAAVLAKLVSRVGFLHVTDGTFVAKVARNGFQFHFPVKRNTEIEYSFASLSSYLFAVCVEGYFLAVGVNLDVGHLFRAVHVTLAADVNEGFLAPICLVAIEAVLLRLSVEGNDAFMVHARLAALISCICREVEHIPKMGRPHEGTFFKEVEHIFVILALIFFALIAAFGVGAVQVGHTFAAVFRIAETTVGVYGMEEIYPKIVQEHAGHVPAEIEVPADDIRNMRRLIEGTAHCVASEGGRTGRIELVYQLVQYAVVVKHILLILRRNGNFIGKTPEADGSVVIILNYELLHLRNGIFSAVGHVLGNIGDLRPNDHTVFIAKVVEILVVLIVRKTDGVGADLADDRHIFVVMLLQKCVADRLSVLMAANAAKGIALAVEEEALFGIYVEITGAEARRHAIHLVAVYAQGSFAGVKIGIFDTVPKMYVFNRDLGILAFSRCYYVAVRILQSDGNDAVFGVMPSANPNLCVLFFHFCVYGNAGAAEMIEAEMIFVYDDQFYVTVNTAVEGKVRLLRIYSVIYGVIHFDNELVFLFQMIGNIKTEGGIAAVVIAEDLFVEDDVRGRVDACKVDIYAFVGAVFGLFEFLDVDAGTASVIVTAVLAVKIIPGVGDIDLNCFAVKIIEGPVVVDK